MTNLIRYNDALQSLRTISKDKMQRVNVQIDPNQVSAGPAAGPALRAELTAACPQVQPVGRTLLTELTKPANSVAVLDGQAFDLLLMFHNAKPQGGQARRTPLCQAPSLGRP